MYRTILVALDGSSLAERALPHAESLARASGARIHLVRAAPPETFAGLGPVDDQTWVMREAETYLREIASRLGSRVPADAAVFYGEAASAIVDEANRTQADLIVMSTHGRSGLGRWVYGSVADEVIRRAEIPVFLVPAAGEHRWPESRPLRVMVPLDGSDLATEAIEPASALAQTFGAELLLVRIVVPPTYAYIGAHPYAYEGSNPYEAFDLDGELAEAGRYLEQIAAPLRSGGLSVRTHVASGNPVAQLAAIAREKDADVIAMATHGTGGLTRLVIGSVATGTIQRASVPLLLVRPSTIRRLSPETGSAAEPTTQTRPISVTLTTRERDILLLGLRELLSHPGPGEACVAEVRSLQARLEQPLTAKASQGAATLD